MVFCALGEVDTPAGLSTGRHELKNLQRWYTVQIWHDKGQLCQQRLTKSGDGNCRTNFFLLVRPAADVSDLASYPWNDKDRSRQGIDNEKSITRNGGTRTNVR